MRKRSYTREEYLREIGHIVDLFAKQRDESAVAAFLRLRANWSAFKRLWQDGELEGLYVRLEAVVHSGPDRRRLLTLALRDLNRILDTRGE